jgi:hypothetical protein
MNLAGHDVADLLSKFGAIGITVGPLAASMVARMVFGKSKIVMLTIFLSADWAAARTFLGPQVDHIQQTLVALISLIQGNGYN